MSEGTDPDSGAGSGTDVGRGSGALPRPGSGPVSRGPDLRRCRRCGALRDLGAASCAICSITFGAPEEMSGLKLRGGAVSEVFRGIAYLPKGLYFLASNRKLWSLAATPMMLNIGFIILAFVAAFSLQGAATESVSAGLEDWTGWWWGSLAVLLRITVTGLEYLAILVIPLIVAVLFSLFGKFLCMPFMEALSARTEKLVLGHVVEDGFTLRGFTGDLVLAILDAIVLTSLQLLAFFILLPLNLVPILGNVLWFLIPGALFASIDYTDMNFIRRRYRVRDRARLWGRYRWRFVGFGGAFFLLAGIPWVNIVTGAFLIPIAAIGGTLLFLELDDKAAVPEPAA